MDYASSLRQARLCVLEATERRRAVVNSVRASFLFFRMCKPYKRKERGPKNRANIRLQLDEVHEKCVPLATQPSKRDTHNFQHNETT
jgi:hypothetical protein